MGPLADWRSEIRRTWAMYDPAALVDDEIYAFPVAQSDGGDLIRCYVAADGSRHLLVPGRSAGSATPTVGESLSCAPIRLVFDGAIRTLVDIGCSHPDLFALFDELLATVLDEAAGADDPAAVSVRVVTQWRDLLRNRASLPLGVQAEMGLFAETWVLELATRGTTFDPTIWRGPLHEPKDIVGPDAWVEVKGVGSASRVVMIHGLEQLAEIDGSYGCLVVVRLAEDDGGRSVADLVELLRPRAADADPLEERLLLAGWDESTASGRTWSVSSIDVVDARTVPRLTPESLVLSLPAGIGGVRYEIDLDVVVSLSVRDPEVVLSTLGLGAP